METQTVKGTSLNVGSTTTNLSNTGTTSSINTWSTPQRVEVNEQFDSIEMVYKETSMLTHAVYPSPHPEVRVFKIIFSCVDGKWNKSERIYGKIVSPQDEYYEFEE